MEYALKNGCQAARVSLYKGSNSSLEVRNMKIDRLQQASESSLMIQLFVDGRYGSYSTNRIDKKELEGFIKNGIDSTRYLAEDTARTLPDASLYYTGGMPDLELYDAKSETLNPDDKVALTMRTCEEIMGKDDRIISAEASYSDDTSYKYMVASNGFEGDSSSSSFSLVASVSIKGEGDARPSSYWYDSSLFYDSLIKQGIGTKALERVISKLGQKKVASGKYTMIVDNMNSARLLSPLISALYGSAIQQKNSFLIDKLDQKIVSNKLTVTDTPHIKRAFGARYFDGEGVATKQLPVIEAGVLKTYYIDTYSANKMNTAPTISGPSILSLQQGEKDLNGIIGATAKGILITGFNGGNSNSTTGDFSFGVEGFLVENGELTQPISEMNITGNILTLWSNLLELGNDPFPSSSWKVPSLVFEGVDFSGL